MSVGVFVQVPVPVEGQGRARRSTAGSSFEVEVARRQARLPEVVEPIAFEVAAPAPAQQITLQITPPPTNPVAFPSSARQGRPTAAAPIRTAPGRRW